jgi:hypothetical protein
MSYLRLSHFISVNEYSATSKRCYRPEQGKRALEIVAAGGHNLLLIGPPGTENHACQPAWGIVAAIEQPGSAGKRGHSESGQYLRIDTSMASEAVSRTAS